MRKILEKFKWLQLVFGFVLIALGVLTIVIAISNKDGDYAKYIFIVWAVVLFLIAGVFVLFDVLAFRDTAEFGTLVGCGICIGIGVFVIVNQGVINDVIKTLLPYSLMAVGGVLIIKTLVLAIRRISFKEWMLPFVVGVVFLTSGLVFFLNKDSGYILYVATGIMFVTLGAVEIIGFITVLANRRAPRNNLQPVKQPKKAKKKKGDEEPAPEYQEGEIVDASPKQIESEDNVKLIE